jgi:hypothetical protein
MSRPKLAPREPFQDKNLIIMQLTGKSTPFSVLFWAKMGKNRPKSVPNAPKNVSLTAQSGSHFLKNAPGKAET